MSTSLLSYSKMLEVIITEKNAYDRFFTVHDIYVYKLVIDKQKLFTGFSDM